MCVIDEHEIMPCNFFAAGGVYTGGHQGMRYMLRQKGEKPDIILEASVWRGPYASEAIQKDQITFAEFGVSEEGRLNAISWIKEQYESRVDEWKQAPSIIEAEPIIHE